MNAKRVLLIHEDRLVGNLYREKLEAEGLAVDSARSGDAGLKVAAERRPDVAVLDAVIPGSEIAQLIAGLRAHDHARAMPIVILPTFRPILTEKAQQAGASAILSRGPNPVADLVDAIQNELGLERTSVIAKGLPFRADDSWLKISMSAAPETLAALRRTLHDMSRGTADKAAPPEFFQRIHGFAEQMSLLGQKPLSNFCAAIEALAFDLVRFPEQRNPSTLHTLGQAVDFLATLLNDGVRERLEDPGTAHVLVVDDEDGARKIIRAAMRLTHLTSVATDTPTATLAALGVQEFDLIFLDVGLPEMTGFELCSKIRTMPMHEKTPIVFITGMATFQNRAQSSLSGGNDFVAKPFNVPELGLKALIWVFKGQLGLT
jgi:DNA-binding response OmpR family regulator